MPKSNSRREESPPSYFENIDLVNVPIEEDASSDVSSDDNMQPSCHDDLSSCEQGKHHNQEGSSIETESLTNDPSLVSSFSSDTQENCSSDNALNGEDQESAHQQCSYGDDGYNVFNTVRATQLRQRRDANQSSLVEESEISDYDEEELSPSAKHKPSRKINRISLGRKLFPFCQWLGMVGFFFYIFTHTSGQVKWRMPNTNSAEKLMRKIENRAVQTAFSKSLTLRIRGGRLDSIRRSLELHAHCASVNQVQIDWQPFGEDDSEFPSELLQHSSGKVVRFDSRSKQQTTNDGIFLLDEAVQLTCNDIDRAFAEWKVDPARLVGFFSDSQESSSPYTLVSDKALLLHRYYLSTRHAYTLKSPLPECQHLALSAYAAAVSFRSPLVMALKSRRQLQPSQQANACTNLLLDTAGMDFMPALQTKFVGHRPGYA